MSFPTLSIAMYMQTNWFRLSQDKCLSISIPRSEYKVQHWYQCHYSQNNRHWKWCKTNKYSLAL